MNKFKKFIATSAIAAVAVTTLASCGYNKGYKDWKVKGLDTRRNGNILFVTVDEVVEMKETEDFIVFFGSSDDGNAKAYVGSFQTLADYLEYDTCIYVCDIAEEAEKSSTLVEAKNKLGIKEIVDETGRKLVCVYYKDGSPYFDTAKYDSNEKNSPLTRFYLKNPDGGQDINFLALAQYAFEVSTVKKEK